MYSHRVEVSVSKQDVIVIRMISQRDGETETKEMGFTVSEASSLRLALIQAENAIEQASKVTFKK